MDRNFSSKQNFKQKVNKIFFDEDKTLENSEIQRLTFKIARSQTANIDSNIPFAKQGKVINLKTNEMEMEMQPFSSISSKTMKPYQMPSESKGKVRNSVGGQRYSGAKSMMNVFSEEEWIKIFKSNSTEFLYNSNRLILSLKYGIPESLRGKIWVHLSKGYSTALLHDDTLYYKLVSVVNPDMDSSINKDVPRTILYNFDKETVNLKSKQEDLFNVLKAYSSYDEEIGYCQGLNCVVAIFLLNIKSERLSFYSFVQLMNERNWRDLYKSNTPKLLRMLGILKENINARLPDLYEYFLNIKLIEIFDAIFSHFFLTLFTYNTPYEYAVRVIDLFWVYEEKIIFDCIIHLLGLQKKVIMSMEIDQVIPYVKNDMVFEAIRTYGFSKSLPYTAELS